MRSSIATIDTHVIAHFDGRLGGRLFAVWGLMLSPASTRATDALTRRGALLVVYDPCSRRGTTSSGWQRRRLHSRRTA